MRDRNACGVELRELLVVKQRRDVVANVLCNLVLKGTDIVSYQYKRPFDALEEGPEGAFCLAWSG